jgi:hypothetical protein
MVCLFSKSSNPRNHSSIPCLESYDDFSDILGHSLLTTLIELTSGNTDVFIWSSQENCAFLTCNAEINKSPVEHNDILKGEFHTQYEKAEGNGVLGRDTMQFRRYHSNVSKEFAVSTFISTMYNDQRNVPGLTRALTPYPGDLNHCRNCIPAPEDWLKDSPKHV